MALKRKTTSRTGKRTDSIPKGLGAATAITVKGARATARQRRVIDGCLAKAHELGASRRVLIAVVMCITQESRAGEDTAMTGNDDTGIYQQGRNWISVTGAKQPGPATEAFLVTGPTSWKKVHGSLKHAPGNLPEAIHRVQGNARASDYAPWESEATKTVDAWLGAAGSGGDGDSRTYVKRYEFTRGERNGARETSWDASGRLGEEVAFRRWAVANVLCYASEDELRAGTPSVEVHGDEPWLLGRPQWDWGSGRPVSELTLRVLADRWDVLPGGVAILSIPGPAKGRWLVKNVSGSSLDSPEATVVLKRPGRHKPEPASETATTTPTGTDSGGGARGLYDECKRISDATQGYLYGGGHGVALSSLTSSQRLDCSSSSSLALKRAGMFPGSVAIVSGAFQSSWGKPGKGRDFTVWANPGHMWIEGYDANGRFAWRFDTVPYGDGPAGPRVRTKRRSDHGRFTARHWS